MFEGGARKTRGPLCTDGTHGRGLVAVHRIVKVIEYFDTAAGISRRIQSCAPH